MLARFLRTMLCTLVLFAVVGCPEKSQNKVEEVIEEVGDETKDAVEEIKDEIDDATN